MRWAALVVRIIGWLLTPLVAWAASFLGAWFVLVAAGARTSPRSLLGLSLAAALVAGVVALLLWRQVLKRFPRLRRSLHVSTAGLPVIEEVPPGGAPASDAPPEDPA